MENELKHCRSGGKEKELLYNNVLDKYSKITDFMNIPISERTKEVESMLFEKAKLEDNEIEFKKFCKLESENRKRILAEMRKNK